MNALANANLTDAERSAIKRFVSMLRRELGEDLLAVWLYGSRARGEGGGRESDVDLMVITESPVDDIYLISGASVDAALAEDEPVYLSAQHGTRDFLHNRREIRSFFAQELDRDKIVVHGEAL